MSFVNFALSWSKTPKRPPPALRPHTFTSYPNARSNATTALNTTDKIAATLSLSMRLLLPFAANSANSGEFAEFAAGFYATFAFHTPRQSIAPAAKNQRTFTGITSFVNISPLVGLATEKISGVSP